MSGMVSPTKRRKKEILKKAFREGRAEEVHETMKRLHFQSIDGYQGDDAVRRSLSQEWVRQIRALPSFSPKTMAALLAPPPQGMLPN